SPPVNFTHGGIQFNLDDDNFEPLWAFASQPFQPYSKGPSQPVENDSLVEEVEPVQPKQKYTRRSKPTKKNDKEFVESWTIKEEISLCKAFVAKSEDSVEGNGKKAAGFWRETILNGKRLKCQSFINPKKSSSKKSRTSENTSQGNSDSTHIGMNLNDEAADSEDVEAQEVPAPMGRDRAKKKGSSSGARSETSIAGDPSLVDALLSKFIMAATPFFTQRKESSSEYLRIKERELELEEQKRQEQGELERMRIAQREKELDLQ
nr:hypothetical protein [Tanacetum cinerariifolium]